MSKLEQIYGVDAIRDRSVSSTLDGDHETVYRFDRTVGEAMARWIHGNYATFDREQWQLLVDVLDGDYDERKLEDAQDALTRAAPVAWLEEAEAADEARRAAADQCGIGGAHR